MTLNTANQVRLRDVLDYTLQKECSNFEEFMYDELGDEADEILEEDWNVSILSNPKVLAVAEKHIYFSAWRLAKDTCPDLT